MIAMTNPTERRPEIEIIPPSEQERRQADGRSRVWIWADDARGARVYFKQPGPFTVLLTFLALAGLVGAGLVVFLGLFLLWLPLLGAVLAVAIVSGMLRGHRRHLR